MGRLKYLVFILFFSFAVSCATVQDENDIQQAIAYYKIGVAYLNENKIQQAFVEFQKAYKHNPNDKEVLNAIGIVYLLHFDETIEAIDYFERATKEDANYSEAYNNLGFAYEKLGRFEIAITYYKKALSNLTYSTPEKAYISMANSYYRLGRYALAIGALKEAIKRAPNLSLSYLRLALCYNARGDYGNAATAMTRAINLHPVYKGDREKATEDFTYSKENAKGYDEQDFRDYLEILNY